MNMNDLFKEMEETKVSREASTVTKGKTKKLYFPPNEDDGELLVKIKEIINDKDLYYADVFYWCCFPYGKFFRKFDLFRVKVKLS